MKACFVGKDETATIQAGDSATKGLPVGFDSFEAARLLRGRPSFAAHDKQSRDELRLWPSFQVRR
jgi:hypothetical protein